jgi:protein PhnA
MYLDEDDLAWAQATGEGEEDENKIIHRDSNGVILEHGDSVVLIKDLKVKGSSMVAKQGTAVKTFVWIMKMLNTSKEKLMVNKL